LLHDTLLPYHNIDVRGRLRIRAFSHRISSL
jgi:hypothetical protein